MTIYRTYYGTAQYPDGGISSNPTLRDSRAVAATKCGQASAQKVALTAVALATNPANVTQGLVAFASGKLVGVNLAFATTQVSLKTGNSSMLEALVRNNAEGERVTDMIVQSWDGVMPSGYLFTNLGRLLSFGGARVVAVRPGASAIGFLSTQPLSQTGQAVKITLDPADPASGYWIDKSGVVGSFGSAPLIALTPTQKRETKATLGFVVDWSFDWANGRWIALTSHGVLIGSPGTETLDLTSPARQAAPHGQFVSFEYDWTAEAGYILDASGGIHAVGDTQALIGGQRWDKPTAKDLSISSWGVDSVFSYWVLDYTGATYFRQSTTAPEVRIVGPWGTPMEQHLVATGAGFFRLKYGDAVSALLSTSDSFAELGAALDSVLGVGSYDLEVEPGYDDGDLYDVTISKSERVAVEVVSDAAITITTTEAGADPIVTETSRPIIEWTYRDAEDDPQGSWETQIWRWHAGLVGEPPAPTDLTKPVWSVTGEGEAVRGVQVATPLPDDATYRVYVRCQEAGGLWSDWAFLDFEMNVDEPTQPTITVAPDPTTASIRLDVDPVAVDERKNRLWVERRPEGGTDSEWALIRGAGAPVEGGFHDDFDRRDSNDIGGPWRLQGKPLSIRNRQVRVSPLDSTLPSVGHLTVVGDEEAADLRSTYATRSISPGDVAYDWTDPRIAPTSGGALFADDFSEVSLTGILPNAPDGSEWTQTAGRWSSEGTGAVALSLGASSRAVTMVDMQADTGRITVLIDRVVGGVDPINYNTYGRVGVAMSMESSGTTNTLTGYLFYGRLNNPTNKVEWVFASVTAGVETILQTWTSAGYDTWGRHRISVDFTATDMTFEVYDYDHDRTYTGTYAHGGGRGLLWGMYHGSLLGGWTTAPNPDLMRWTEFRWIHPQYALPGAASLTGVWYPSPTGDLFSLNQSGTLQLKTEPDAALTATFSKAANGDRLLFRHDGAWSAYSIDDNVTAASGKAIIGSKGFVDYVLAYIDGAAIADGDRITVELSERFVRIKVNDAYRTLTLVNGAFSTSLVSTSWTTTNGTDSGTLNLAASGTSLLRTEQTATVAVDAGLRTGPLGASFVLNQTAGLTGVYAQAYLAEYNVSAVLTGVIWGPKVALDSGGADATVEVHGETASTTTHVRHGLVFHGTTAATTIHVTSLSIGVVDALLMWPEMAHNTSWIYIPGTEPNLADITVSPTASVVGASTPSVAALDLGAASTLRYSRPLSQVDAAVIDWGSAASDPDDLANAVDAAMAFMRSRVRYGFASTYTVQSGTWVTVGTAYPPAQKLVDAQGATFTPNGRIIASVVNTSVVSIDVPAVTAGEVLAVGVVITTATTDGLSYKRPADGAYVAATTITGGALDNNSVGNGFFGTPAVVHIPLAASASPQQILLRCDGEVALDWWGILPVESPRFAVVGVPVEDPPGTEVAVNTALSALVTAHADEKITFAARVDGELTPQTTILDALLGSENDPAMYQGLLFVEALTPGVEAQLIGTGWIFAGVDSIEAPTTGVALRVDDDPGAPGTARVRSWLGDTGAWVLGTLDVSTAIALTAPVRIGVRLNGTNVDLSVEGVVEDTEVAPTGTVNGIELTSPDALLDDVTIGGHLTPVYDYEGVPGFSYEYRARVSNPTLEIFTEPVVVGVATAPQVGYWLKNPLRPYQNLRVRRVEDDFEVTLTEEQGVFVIPGRGTDIVVTGATKAPKIGAQTFAANGETERDAIRDILSAGETLLFQSPRGEQWYLRFGPTVGVKSIMDAIGRPIYEITTADPATVDRPA